MNIQFELVHMETTKNIMIITSCFEGVFGDLERPRPTGDDLENASFG
jgi:hypothetical protein